MTLDQGLAFTIVIAMMGLFAWGRWRYDLVAVLTLLVAVAVGIVKPNEAFKGFSDDIVIIVGSALVVSAAVARSGVIERAAAGSDRISPPSTARSWHWLARSPCSRPSSRISALSPC
jgi:hypothetical protein